MSGAAIIRFVFGRAVGAGLSLVILLAGLLLALHSASPTDAQSCSPRSRLSGANEVRNISGRELPGLIFDGNQPDYDRYEFYVEPNEVVQIMGSAFCADGSWWVMAHKCLEPNASGMSHCRQGYVQEGRGSAYYLEPVGASVRRPTQSCALEPRLRVGMTVRNASDSNNNVRSAVGTRASIAGVFRPGETAEVIGGPLRADGYYWWKIRRGSLTGWTVESGDCRYWVVPHTGSSSSSSRSSSSSSSSSGVGTKGSIAYGQSRTGTLNDSNYFDDYDFNGRAGDVITITMDNRSGNLDPMLRLYDSSGRGLTENDDGGSGTNARINRYRLSRTGRYTIHALRYGSGQSGGYRLALTRNSTQPPTATLRPTRRPTRRPFYTPTPQSISIGQRVTSSLPYNYEGYSLNAERFSFFAREGEVINIAMDRTSGNLDPGVDLRTLDRDLLDMSWDGGVGNNALIENYRITSSGTFLIIAFVEEGSGNYRLSLTRAEPTATPRPTSTPRPQTISYGQTKTGSLSSSDWYDRYEFRAQAGDLISISMNRTSGGLDPQLDLRSSSGVYLIGNNDRTSVNNDALISNYLIADSGAYQIRARRRSGSGNYRLTLSKAEPTATNTPRPTNTPLPTSTPTPESLAFGQTASGNLSASDTADLYTFSAREGDVVTIALDRWSGDLDPELWLRRSGDSVWQIDADSGSGSSALIQDFRVPASDIYELAARRQSGSGTYRLQLSRAEPTPTPLPIETIQRISYGQTVSGSLDDAAPFQSYQFVAQAGELITIDMRRVGGKLDPLVWLMDESGERIALDDDGGEGSNALLGDFRIADAGAYIVQARRYSGEGSFSLSLSARPPTPTPTPVPPPIAYGENVTGSLDDDTPFQQYRFDARAGDVITLDMRNTSGKLDPLLRLWDNEGALLAEDDDGGVGGNALIDSLEIERAGAYIAQAGRYGGDGSYSLALSRQP